MLPRKAEIVRRADGRNIAHILPVGMLEAPGHMVPRFEFETRPGHPHEGVTGVIVIHDARPARFRAKLAKWAAANGGVEEVVV